MLRVVNLEDPGGRPSFLGRPTGLFASIASWSAFFFPLPRGRPRGRFPGGGSESRDIRGALFLLPFGRPTGRFVGMEGASGAAASVSVAGDEVAVG